MHPVTFVELEGFTVRESELPQTFVVRDDMTPSLLNWIHLKRDFWAWLLLEFIFFSLLPIAKSSTFVRLYTGMYVSRMNRMKTQACGLFILNELGKARLCSMSLMLNQLFVGLTFFRCMVILEFQRGSVISTCCLCTNLFLSTILLITTRMNWFSVNLLHLMYNWRTLVISF